MKIVLATFGSRGDVQPFIVLGQALVRAGHEVVLCASEDFGGFVTGSGLSFQALDSSFGEWLRDSAKSQGKLMENMRRSLARRLEVLPKVVEGADLLVCTDLLVEGRSVAEALGVAYRYVALCPCVQRSRHHAGPAFPVNHSPAWFNRLSWWFTRVSWNTFAGGPVNAWRVKSGLAPTQDLFSEAVTDSTVLAAGEPPVYIGFGSMLDEDPARTTCEVLEAVRAAGVRALVARGWAGLGGESLPPEVLASRPSPSSARASRPRASPRPCAGACAPRPNSGPASGPPRCARMAWSGRWSSSRARPSRGSEPVPRGEPRPGKPPARPPTCRAPWARCPRGGG